MYYVSPYLKYDGPWDSTYANGIMFVNASPDSIFNCPQDDRNTKSLPPGYVSYGMNESLALQKLSQTKNAAGRVVLADYTWVKVNNWWDYNTNDDNGPGWRHNNGYEILFVDAHVEWHQVGWVSVDNW
jgi:prepilin-type processing-associated H-X9-DG protein